MRVAYTRRARQVSAIPRDTLSRLSATHHPPAGINARAEETLAGSAGAHREPFRRAEFVV